MVNETVRTLDEEGNVFKKVISRERPSFNAYNFTYSNERFIESRIKQQKHINILHINTLRS